MQSYIDTIFSEIHNDFINSAWSLTKKNNTYLQYKNGDPYDEFRIESIANDYEYINVSIPIGNVGYNKTFNSIDEALKYIKMHLKNFRINKQINK